MAGGLLSGAAAVLHLAVIAGGPAWYRFFGAGEGMAKLAERGSLFPAEVTLAIAVLLAIWALYAFSGAGVLPRLPLVRTALVLITSAYLLRGLALFPTLWLRPQIVDAFTFWSSWVVLGFGVTHGIGIWTAWPRLSRAVRA